MLVKDLFKLATTEGGQYQSKVQVLGVLCERRQASLALKGVRMFEVIVQRLCNIRPSFLVGPTRLLKP